MMRTPMVYLGSPIDFGRIGGLRDVARNEMARRGWVVFDPLGAFTVTSDVEPDKRIRQVNHGAMFRSDGMLALLASDCVSVGVPMEIERMTSGWGTPVAVVGHGVGRSWSLVGLPQVAVFDLTTQENALEEALAWLEGQMSARAVGGAHERPPMSMFVRADGRGLLPTRAHEGDAGFDLYVSEDTEIRPGHFVDVPHDIAIELPESMWARIAGRSSTLRKRGLLVAEGIIDQGYRGPLYTGVWNLGDRCVTVKAGERISQLIPSGLDARLLDVREVRHLRSSDRGEAGFGSSGA